MTARRRMVVALFPVLALIGSGASCDPGRENGHEHAEALRRSANEDENPFAAEALAVWKSGRNEPIPILGYAEASNRQLHLIVLDMSYDILGMRFLIAEPSPGHGYLLDCNFTYYEASRNVSGIALVKIKVPVIVIPTEGESGASRSDDGRLEVRLADPILSLSLQVFDAEGNFSNQLELSTLSELYPMDFDGFE